MRIRMIVAISFLVASLAQTDPAAAEGRAGWKTYALPEMGLLIQAPPDFIYEAPNPSSPNLGDRMPQLFYPDESGQIFVLLTTVDNPQDLTLRQWVKSLEEGYGYVPDYRDLVVGAGHDIKAIHLVSLFEGQIDDEVVFRDAGGGKLIQVTLIIRGIDDWMEVPREKLEARYAKQIKLYNHILATIQLVR